MSCVYLGTRHRNGSRFLSFPSATFGHFRQKQPSVHWNSSVRHPVIQEQSNNHFKNVACDSCEEEFTSSGGKCCVPSILLMSLLMGLGEAECAACHFEIGFQSQWWSPFPASASPPQQDWCQAVQGLLHIQASWKEGPSRGLCPGGRGWGPVWGDLRRPAGFGPASLDAEREGAPTGSAEEEQQFCVQGLWRRGSGSSGSRTSIYRMFP